MGYGHPFFFMRPASSLFGRMDVSPVFFYWYDTCGSLGFLFAMMDVDKLDILTMVRATLDCVAYFDFNVIL
jgi:hypothetical protein